MKFIGLVAVLITLVGCQTAATNQGNDNSVTSNTRSGTTKRSGTQIKLKEVQTFNGFSSPTGIALDEEKNIYVTNWSGGTITKITPDGEQSDFSSAIGSPSGIAYLDNHLYVSDYGGNVIYRLTLEGEKEVFARDLRTPAGISISQDGNLLVANRASNEIIKLNSVGEKEVIARDLETPVAALELENGDLYVSNYGGGIIRVSDQVNEDFSRDMAALVSEWLGILNKTSFSQITAVIVCGNFLTMVQRRLSMTALKVLSHFYMSMDCFMPVVGVMVLSPS